MAPKFTKFVFSKVSGIPDTTVILSDYQYWAQRERELDDWCRDHGVTRQGMTLVLDDDTLVLFFLKWS